MSPLVSSSWGLLVATQKIIWSWERDGERERERERGKNKKRPISKNRDTSFISPCGQKAAKAKLPHNTENKARMGERKIETKKSMA